MAAASQSNASGDLIDRDVSTKHTAAGNFDPGSEASEIEVRTEDLWQKMNKGLPDKTLRRFTSNSSTAVNKSPTKMSNSWAKYLQLKTTNTGIGSADKAKTLDGRSDQVHCQKLSNSWMTRLGLSQKEPGTVKDETENGRAGTENMITDDSKKLAAAALSAVKNAALVAATRGKHEVTEVRDFAGQDIEIKRHIDAESKEASEKAKAGAPSAVDAVLEQIKKKPKLSVLDKTKKDWGDFKEDKGLEVELDAYKKSSNQYLDKVSFLQRTDYREFERERDARLAVQARRRPDMREDTE